MCSILGLQIPPITVSNPSDTFSITEKIFDFSSSIEKRISDSEIVVPINTPPQHSPTAAAAEAQPEPPRKEQRSVMREILAFVRKPSKKAATRTGKFAAAFSRAESNLASPLLRQSTFSSSPRASSGAAKNAVTKQLSEAGIESKMSLKILNSKMSFRLRRSADKNKEKKSSGDEMSDMESSDSKVEKQYSSSSDMAFELDQVRFEKVGDLYHKHEKIREETIEDSTPSPVQIVDINEAIRHLDNQTNNASIHLNINSNNNNYYFNNNNKNNSYSANETDELNKTESFHENHHQFQKSGNNDSVDSIKEDGININGNLNQQATTFTDEKVNILKSTLEHLVLKPEPVYANLIDLNKKEIGDKKTELQCPTFEIMPPSRRSSFDPPRSPYLENLRSDTDPEIMNLNRLDSAGDSFEMIETDRNRESSFESRYPSSSHTSFDISRYQSTSCEDPTSSFEIIDMDNQKSNGNDDVNKIISTSATTTATVTTTTTTTTTFDVLRKSSIEKIELVDVETFQKSGSTGRKSSLETHFDFAPSTPSSRLSTPKAKKQSSESNNKPYYISNVGMKSHYSTPHHRTRSPLFNQSSSNYSSRDSHDSYNNIKMHQQNQTYLLNQTSLSIRRSSFADPTKQHSPVYTPSTNESYSDQHLEPRPHSNRLNQS